MAHQPDFPVVEVAAVAITRGPKILALYNHQWGAFTLPMSERRAWHDPNVPRADHVEEWLEAAARASAEILGRTCTPVFLLDNQGEYQKSGRDGQWKRYHFQIFHVHLDDDPRLVPGAVVEWLTPEEFSRRRPISPTARYLIAKLQEEGAPRELVDGKPVAGADS
jgi:hypothetical protein